MTLINRCYSCAYYAPISDWYGECRLSTPIKDYAFKKTTAIDWCCEHKLTADAWAVKRTDHFTGGNIDFYGDK